MAWGFINRILVLVLLGSGQPLALPAQPMQASTIEPGEVDAAPPARDAAQVAEMETGPSATAAERDITFDFRNAEISIVGEFLAAVSGLALVMPDDVEGRISLAADEPISLEEAFRLLSAQLDVQNLTMLRDDRFLRLMLKASAVQQPTEVFYGNAVDDVPLEDRVITQIIPIDNISASEVLESILSLVSSSGNAFVNRETNLLVLTETATNIRRLMQLINYLDVRRTLTETEDTRVYRVRYMKAAAMTAALESVFGGGQRAEPVARITPVDEVNAVIVTAASAEHSQILQTMDALDVRRPQVLIEIKIVEGTVADTESVGINLLEYLIKSTDALHTITSGSSVPDPFVTYTLDSNEVDLVLTAAAREERVNILSAPRVLTSDNHEARIVVAQEEPILNSVTDVSAATATPRTVSEFTYRDVGIEMTVTPRINVDRDVALDVAFLVTSLLANVDLPGESFAPRIGKRQASTSVTVMDGSTLVIGGLIKDSVREQRRKVPLLGDIPLLGKLFSATRRIKEQTELLVFITPRVATSVEEEELLSREEEELLSQAEANGAQHGGWRIETLPAPAAGLERR